MNTARKFKTLIISIVMGLPALAFSANIEGEKNDDGSFKKWHRIEVVFDGPQVNESSATFRDFRLDVTFTSPSGGIFRTYLRRNPTEAEQNILMAGFENVTAAGMLSDALEHTEFISLIDNQTYLEALFQQILLTDDYDTSLFSTLLTDLNSSTRNRWETLVYLLDSPQCTSALSDADFALYLYTETL